MVLSFKRSSVTKARFVNWLILLIIIYNIFNIHYWTKDKRVIYYDVISYYAYLPACFIYKDLSLEFIDENPVEYSDKFWPNKTSDGKYTIKTSMGMSYLYSPFFFIGHLSAKITGEEANGFSKPYKFWLLMGSVIYLAIGLYFLRKVLEMFFSQNIIIFTLIAIVLGTNFYIYSTVDATMPHVYNFSLFAIFVFLSINWYKSPSVKRIILLGLLAGLITLIRPTNIIIILIFLLWGINSFKNFKERLILFVRNPIYIIGFTISFIIIWIPQFIYWKMITGHWLYFSYQDESFFFLDPHIWDGLFGYRKGWFVYTPVMLFAITGLIISFKQFREIFTPILVFLVFNIYIILSWWSWWYGGSFGNRAFIDSYAILALPLAVCFTWLMNLKKKYKIIPKAILLLLILLNIFQSWQYYGGDLHHDAMTKKAYWMIFLKPYPSEEYKNYLEHPDYEKAKMGLDKFDN